MADVTQTLDHTTGTDGRVKVHAGSPVIIAGISLWKRTGTTGTIRLPHFESPAHPTTGVVFPRKAKGLGDEKIRIEGIYNRDATAQTETGNTGLTNGASVALDLMTSKEDSSGHENVVGFVSNFEHGQDINDKAATFACDVEVDGVLPEWGAVT